MCSIVRRQCRPDSVLTIVGGNSINHGVGQPAGQIWTEQLQRELGGGYCVVNFALRGAVMTDGAGVIAEVLRREYPRQIYIANSAPLLGIDSMGTTPYRYLFWEAYFKGWLEPWPARDTRVEAYLSREAAWAERWLLRASHAVDSTIHYRDLWNWVGYERFFTLFTPLTPELSSLFEPRRRFADAEPDNRTLPIARRFGPEVQEEEMRIVRTFTERYYVAGPSGSWVANENIHGDFRTAAHAAVPDRLKRRTLVIAFKNSPYFVEKLTPAERARDDLAYVDAVVWWRESGYGAITYGSDFGEPDFGDRTHLSVPGGRKLAAQVAPVVKKMARELGYSTSP